LRQNPSFTFPMLPRTRAICEQIALLGLRPLGSPCS
jgi:hypothetical protein